MGWLTSDEDKQAANEAAYGEGKAAGEAGGVIEDFVQDMRWSGLATDEENSYDAGYRDAEKK